MVLGLGICGALKLGWFALKVISRHNTNRTRCCPRNSFAQNRIFFSALCSTQTCTARSVVQCKFPAQGTRCCSCTEYPLGFSNPVLEVASDFRDLADSKFSKVLCHIYHINQLPTAVQYLQSSIILQIALLISSGG